MQMIQSRRDFLASTSLAVTAGVLGTQPSLADAGPPETTTIRLGFWPASACVAAQTVVEGLLRAEGFTEVHLAAVSHIDSVARGELDFDSENAPWLVAQVDAGQPITVLSGMHVGCYELFVHEPIRTVADLKGTRVGIDYLGGGVQLYLAVMVAQIGLDPARDIEWVPNPDGTLLDHFAAGKIDAILAFPPEPQELRARKIGRAILNTTIDVPWSHYFCCMFYGRRQFVRDYPVATKRFLRAVLKASDMCALQPEVAVQQLADAGFTGNHDYALQTLRELPYDKWRTFDPEDSLRFFALRLHEVGLIQSSPNTLLSEGTDWRFLNELKRELKA
jgi:NitT/TauT family transport system substrate-binding protein